MVAKYLTVNEKKKNNFSEFIILSDSLISNYKALTSSLYPNGLIF